MAQNENHNKEKNSMHRFSNEIMRRITESTKALRDYYCDRTDCRKVLGSPKSHSMRDEFAHALVSAGVSYDSGYAVSWILGEMKEVADYWSNTKGLSKGVQAQDAWVDRWNNEIGWHIGLYVKEHQLAQSDIPSLIYDAFNTGRMAFEGTFDPRYIQGNYSPLWFEPSDEWLKTQMQACGVRTSEAPTIHALKECRRRVFKENNQR